MMAKKPKKKEEEQFIDLPEDRVEQISSISSQEKENAAQIPSVSQKPEQVQDVVDSNAEDTGDVPAQPTMSREDLLADIRHELAGEEENVVEKKGFLGRIKDSLQNLSRGKKEVVESQTPLESAIETQDDLQEIVIEPKPKKKKRSATKQEEKAIQEFFSDLEALAEVMPDGIMPEVVEPPEPDLEEKKSDEKAKLPRLPVRSEDKRDIDFEKVREVALQEYDTTQLEPTYERKVSLQEEVRKTVRESKPLERVLLFGGVALVAAVLLFSGIFIIVRSIPTPTPVPTVVINLEEMVYPKQLNLPGGWGFNLGQGQVVEGKWSPRGSEWLVGTEISRWVALPWSLQLEAVLRTLKSGDTIELQMSNLDQLEYKVYSIEEMTMEEIQALDTKTPGLLVILYEEEDSSDTHWVVTALP
jgi:hypothetical protein